MNWFFTFGTRHTDAQGNSLGNCYVHLEGGFGETRAMMFEARGDKWGLQYAPEDFAGQVAKYGLVEVTLEQVRLCQ